ncbi:MAG: D-ribose pyranase [Ignavibacteriales bacterium]|nr:MAG: D-ribose pyranase [Ignavibacteriales bacterium]
MKKGGILNAQLAQTIASFGHGDWLVICDCGYPIPHGAKVIDLSVTINLPRIIDVAKAILDELKIESIIITNEMEQRSSHILKSLKEIVPENIPIKKICHEEFKKINNEQRNITFVKTGEATPFANFILVAGVVF